MLSRTALLFVALAGVTLCVTANAGDAGLETSEGASGRSLLGKKSPPKYFVFQNAGNDAFIFDPDTQIIVGKGTIVNNNNNDIKQGDNTNFNGRKLQGKKPYSKYVVFQNAQNSATIVDSDTQKIFGSGLIFNNNNNDIKQGDNTNVNLGRKLLKAPWKKYVVFQNAQNQAVIFDPDTQIVVGGGAIFNNNNNSIKQGDNTNING